MQLCINGEATSNQLDGIIDIWHDSNVFIDRTLRDVLGLDNEEYEAWVEADSYFQKLIERKKSEQQS